VRGNPPFSRSTFKSFLRQIFITRQAALWLIGLTTLLVTLHCEAADGEWVLDGDGNWGVATNWTLNQIASGTGSIANFSLNTTADRTVTLDTSRTIGRLLFNTVGDNIYGWNFISSGGAVLTLDNGSQTPTIETAKAIAPPVRIYAPMGGTHGFIKLGVGNLALFGPNTFTGDIMVNDGVIFAQNVAAFGTSPSRVIVSNGASIFFLEGAQGTMGHFPQTFIINGFAPALHSGNGRNFDLDGDIILATDSSILCDINASFAFLGKIWSTNSSLIFTNEGSRISSINGDIHLQGGGLIKGGPSTLWLAASNSYTGPTTIYAGTLSLTGAGSINNTSSITISPNAEFDLSGANVTTLTLGNGQVLKGSGTVTGSVVETGGASISPGISGIGTLTITGSVILQGATTMDLANTGNDVINVSSSITYGGSLILTFPPGLLVGGKTFKLFSAASYSGQFSTIGPPPAPNLFWNTNNLTVDGTLGVLLWPTLTTTQTNGNIQINWPTNYSTFVLQSATNLIEPITWSSIATSGNTHITSPTNDARYFRLVH
jgi:autotransporter-associated beta strand protein